MHEYDLQLGREWQIIFVDNKEVKVSTGDLPWLIRYSWHIASGYVCNGGGYSKHIMHRLIMDIDDPKFDVHHKNCNKLDNRRENLEILSRFEHTTRRPAQRNNTTGYKGVSMIKSTGKFRASLTKDDKTKNLGHFDTVEEAAQAYDNAAKAAFGLDAYLNFPV